MAQDAPALPTTLPPGVDLVSMVKFSDPNLQMQWDSGLASVPDGHSAAELEVHYSPEAGASAYIFGVQKSGDGHWALEEILGVQYRAGNVTPEAGIRVRWSA